MFRFEITHRDSSSSARTGTFLTPHGTIETPVFMPVGTRGAIRGLTPQMVHDTGTTILLANTYHLLQRPGPELIAQWGGLHRFMAWDGPILTDSGGYQVFSLADLAQVDDEAVVFRSHLDGRRIVMTPQSVIETQNLIGADIIMVLDQCPPYPCDKEIVAEAVRRTVDWAHQCRRHHHREDQALFGIVQGGIEHDLRRQCAEQLLEFQFPGYAIGGLSVGEPHEQMIGVLDQLVPLLPADRPRYLMGVGMPRDILESVRHGVDMFDCVLPTRNGRNAHAFTATGPVRLRNEQHKNSREPIEIGCDCYTCTHFSRGYIRHLFAVDEMLGPILTSLHNIRFFQRFMTRIREGIAANTLQRVEEEFPIARTVVTPDPHER